MACVDGDADAVREPEFACFGLHPVPSGRSVPNQPVCLKLVGGSPTTSSPSTPSVGPAAHVPPTQAGPCSSLGAANRRFPATLSRQTLSMPLEVPAGLRMAQGVQVVQKRGRGRCARVMAIGPWSGDRGRWSRKDEVAVAELVPAIAVLARGVVAVLDQPVSGGRREHLEVR